MGRTDLAQYTNMRCFFLILLSFTVLPSPSLADINDPSCEALAPACDLVCHELNRWTTASSGCRCYPGLTRIPPLDARMSSVKSYNVTGTYRGPASRGQKVDFDTLEYMMGQWVVVQVQNPHIALLILRCMD